MAEDSIRPGLALAVSHQEQKGKGSRRQDIEGRQDLAEESHVASSPKGAVAEMLELAASGCAAALALLTILPDLRPKSKSFSPWNRLFSPRHTGVTQFSQCARKVYRGGFSGGNT